jgi:uncharacterized protein (TIRG00374 family)
MGRRQLVGWALLLVALSGGGLWLATRADGLSWGRVVAAMQAATAAQSWLSLGVLALLAVGIYVGEAVRYRAFSQALGVHIGWRVAFDAGVADFFFSAVTPGATMGAPAAAALLVRAGLSWEAAGLIAFAKTVGSVAVILLAALACFALGIGPPFAPWIGALLALTCAFVLVWVGVMAWAARHPERAQGWLRQRLQRFIERPSRSARTLRWLAATERATLRVIDRLGALRDAPPRALLGVAFGNVLYFGAIIGVGALLAVSLGAPSWTRSVGASTVYTAVMFAVPTPGASGVSEASGPAFFAGLLSPADAVLVVLGYRALTLYAHLLFGALYLAALGLTSPPRAIDPDP